MSLRVGPVGPRGLAVLSVTAIAGLVLANHGWSVYHGMTTPGSIAGGATAHLPSTPTARSNAGHSQSAGPTSSPSSSPGPLLSSEPYAQYAFQVWPGTPSAGAKAALTGLSVTVRSVPGGLSVIAGVNGQAAGASHLYPGGIRVYIVEASMGDDSGASDYNLGDDGLVVTDAQGRIVQ